MEKVYATRQKQNFSGVRCLVFWKETQTVSSGFFFCVSSAFFLFIQDLSKTIAPQKGKKKKKNKPQKNPVD